VDAENAKHLANQLAKLLVQLQTKNAKAINNTESDTSVF